MNRMAGRLLLCWSVVAFGAGALAGPSLHALPGCGHEDRSHGHPDEGPRGEPLGAPSDDDCAICLAIEAPSILASAPIVVGHNAVSSPEAEAGARVWIAGHSGRWCCRAPPLFGSIRVD